MRPPSPVLRRLLLVIVGGPLVAAALLLIGEWSCRALTPSDSPLAPPRYFELRAATRDAPAALVPSARPPFANARFWPESIPVAKPAGVLRVLCLGDSTVHGHPFEPPAAFPDWLAVRLPHLLPGRRFEVWNLGANAMNSEAVLDLARELGVLHPDLVVVYVGHNEFLDAWREASERPLTHRVHRLLATTWLGRRVSSWLPSTPAPAVQPTRSAGGAGAVDDEPALAAAAIARGLRNFEENLGAIARTIHAMDATPVLCAPVCDAVDTPPERSCFAASTPSAARPPFREHLARLREERLALEARLRAEAAADVGARARELLAETGELARVDATVAQVAYERGRLLRLAGDGEAARAALLEARDLDAEPIRATSRLLAIVRAVAAREEALLVDPWPLFVDAAAAQLGLPGQDGFFVDYVHPEIAGQRLIADAILRELARRGVFAPATEWRFADEPDLATYEAAMGFSAQRQADSLARRGLFALGQGQLDPGAVDSMRAAEALFTTALAVEPRCALAHAGRGALALVRGDGAAGLAELDRAHELDPAALSILLENYEKLPVVRDLFERAGVTVKDGRFVKR